MVFPRKLAHGVTYYASFDSEGRVNAKVGDDCAYSKARSSSWPCIDCVGKRHWKPRQDDIEADLAPLSREECARRGILHSSEDDHAEVSAAATGPLTLRAVYRNVKRRER